MNPHTGHRHLTFKAHNGSQYENVEFNSVLSPFDENAEWAKINDIMATFSGGFARSRNTYRESSDVEPGVHHHCPGKTSFVLKLNFVTKRISRQKMQ